MALTGARMAALTVLRSVRGGNTLDSAFEAAESTHFSDLDPRDRGFARLMALTVLRRQGQIDDALGRCLERPLAAKYANEREILRLGAAQLLFLGAKPHGAVDETVELADKSILRGLINAVLRRLVREGEGIVAAQGAERLWPPQWLWTQWTETYGEDTARAMVRAHLTQSPLDLTVKSDPEGWALRLSGAVTPLGSVRIGDPGPVPDLAGYSDGEWWVQDAASALPARLLLGALENPSKAKIADVCAAPGGKTAQLCQSGAQVFAIDRSARRLQRLRQNLDRLGLTAEIVAIDGAQWTPPQPLDAVLLDAPCTATGTIRRHPDIPWAKDAANAERLTETQDRLLAAAAAMVAPGGVLIYCVCSTDRREGEDRIAGFLKTNPEFARQPVEVREVGGMEALVNDDGDLRTLPCHLAEMGGMDGFYAARLRRSI